MFNLPALSNRIKLDVTRDFLNVLVSYTLAINQQERGILKGIQSEVAWEGHVLHQPSHQWPRSKCYLDNNRVSQLDQGTFTY